MSEALPIEVFEFRRNAREAVKIKLDSFKGHNVVDVRTWWRNGESELQPGRAGLTLAVHHLPALAAGIGRALEQAMALGLLTKGGES